MQPYHQIVVAVKCFLVYQKRALILHRSKTDPISPGIWEYPGGQMMFGEAFHETLLREVHEETGLTATLEDLQYAITLKTSPERQIVVLNYLGKANNGNVTLSCEHDDYLWATQADLERLLEPTILEHLHKYNLLNRVEILPE